MINVFVEGSSWPEVSRELRKMLGDEPKPVETECADYEELEALRRQLDESDARAESYENTCASLRDQNREQEKKYKMLCDDCSNLAAEKTNLELELLETKKLLCDVEEKLDIANATIELLENQLADAKAPKQAEPTEGDTETPVKPEEEQTEIPEVTQAPVKEYKKEEVRAALCQCRAANIPISEILAPYGGSLGAVKKEDYAKLMEDAEAALAMAERSK